MRCGRSRPRSIPPGCSTPANSSGLRASPPGNRAGWNRNNRRAAPLHLESFSMASAPQSQLPLFYNSLEPLSSQAHAKFRTRTRDKAPFLANQHAVPLTIDEFPLVQRFMPIVFTLGDDAIPIALMGLNEGVNVFVDGEGTITEKNLYIRSEENTSELQSIMRIAYAV